MFALLTSGCGNGQAVEPVPLSTFTQADADQVSVECGADRGWLKVTKSGAVMFEPPNDGNYEASACIIQRLKDSGITKFGFLGNDKAAPDE